MRRLLGSEWMRVWSRRLVRVLVVLALVGIAATGIIAAVVSHRPTVRDHVVAVRRYERSLVRCEKHDAFGSKVPAGSTVEEVCRGIFSVSSFENASQVRLNAMPEIVRSGAFMAVLLALVIGASMVGASWQSGTITTILSWEPRRIRWFLARAMVTVVTVFLLTVALLALLTLAITLASAVRGSTEVAPGWFGDTAGAVLRVAAVAAAASMIGAAIAMIGRNTAAALGAVIAYVVLMEGVIRGLRPSIGRFLLGENLTPIVTGKTFQLFVGGERYLVTQAHGWLVVALYLAVLMMAAAVLLRVRDVN